MNDRFTGLTGGKIFRYMMVRNGVERICKFTTLQLDIAATDSISIAFFQLDTLAVLFSQSLTPSITAEILALLFPDMNRVLGI